ncbi:MAG: sigma-70 family RNA polymerase sigma factor [Rubripirellula sp.]
MSSQGSHERASGSAVGAAAGAGSSGSSAKGDAAELLPAELIARHQRGIWRYLRMLGCDDSMADDLMQETFLRVLRRDNFVQHSEAATSSYLRRTAYNLLVSDHRKHKRVQSMADSPLMDEIWDRWAGKDLSGDRAVDALKDCLSILTDRARLALQMRYGKDATRIEIAEALEISDHGARNLIQRAKGQLRECVEVKLQLNIDQMKTDS